MEVDRDRHRASEHDLRGPSSAAEKVSTGLNEASSAAIISVTVVASMLSMKVELEVTGEGQQLRPIVAGESNGRQVGSHTRDKKARTTTHLRR